MINNVPPNQPLKRDQTVRLGLAAIVCLFAFLFGSVACSDGSGASSPKIEQSPQAEEVTYRGCLIYAAQRDALVLVTEDGTYFDLVGNIKPLLTDQFGLPVSVRGVEVSGGKLDVKHSEVIEVIAELNRSLTDPSQWIRKTDKVYGLSFEVPKEASFSFYPFGASDDFWANSIGIFDIRFPVSNLAVHRQSSAYDGQLQIYVNTGMSEKDTYAAPEKIRPSHKRHRPSQSFWWINGLKCTKCVDPGDIRRYTCILFTFQNNSSYRIEFSIETGQPGMVDWGCLIPRLDSQQVHSFIRLFLSQVAFLRPEVPAAESSRAVKQ